MVTLLFFSVLKLFCFMIPAFILRKTGLAGEGFAKILSIVTLYVAQPAMLLHGFLLDFSIKTFIKMCVMLPVACAIHAVFYLIARMMFRRSPEKSKRVLQFGMIFSNAGYMGIPVITDVLGEEYAIYATMYVVAFNLFAFTLGRLIYTGDKKYISIKSLFINPSIIPIMIGIVLYVTGIGGKIAACSVDSGFISGCGSVLYDVASALTTMVAPASMMVIGARLADTSFRGIFRDGRVYLFAATRLFFFPAAVFAVLRLLSLTGIVDNTVTTVALILSSTPAAAITTMFAELYDGDAAFSGKLVALTTLLSVLTMPTVALLLQI